VENQTSPLEGSLRESHELSLTRFRGPEGPGLIEALKGRHIIAQGKAVEAATLGNVPENDLSLSSTQVEERAGERRCRRKQNLSRWRGDSASPTNNLPALFAYDQSDSRTWCGGRPARRFTRLETETDSFSGNGSTPLAWPMPSTLLSPASTLEPFSAVCSLS